MTTEKHFPKTISQWEFDYGLFTNLSTILVTCNFFPSSFTLRRGILPLLTKYQSLLENYMSYYSKIFLVNETPRELTLAKYLISVAANLMHASTNFFYNMQICWHQKFVAMTILYHDATIWLKIDKNISFYFI